MRAQASATTPSLKSDKSVRAPAKRKSVQFGGIDLAHFPKGSSPTVINGPRRTSVYTNQSTLGE